MKRKVALWSLMSICLTAMPAMAKSKIDLNQFVGRYELVQGQCEKDISIAMACEGVKVSKVLGGKPYDMMAFCNVDKGANRDLSKSYAGHGMIPGIEYTKTVVTSDRSRNQINKVETSKDFSIIVFSSQVDSSIRMENENQLVLQTKIVTDASDSDSDLCVYKRVQ